MRFTAPIAALVLAAIAWMACWQQVQLVRLKHSIATQAAAPAAPASPGPAAAPAPKPTSQLDQLRSLLIERRRAIADARDAASDFDIAEGSPEMDQAIALATHDLDQSIIKLAGPAAASQLSLTPLRASIPEYVQAAPAPSPAPVPAPAPIYISTPPANVYVNVVSPPPAVIAADPAPDPQPVAAVVPAYPAVYGFGRYVARPGPGRGENHRTYPNRSIRDFANSAGIPLKASPLAAAATTSSLFLIQQRSASVASGR